MQARWPGLAATYVAAVVGAGFASGREAYQFFAAYGVRGLFGAILAGALFAVLGAVGMNRVATRRHRHGGELFRDVCGPRLGWAVDRVAIAGLFLVLAAALSAAGALAHLLLHWPVWLGCAALAVALATAGVGGRRVFVGANLLATPGLLVAVLGLAVASLLGGPPAPSSGPTPGLPPWPLAATLYVGYNLTLALGGLCAATEGGTAPADATAGGAVGGGLLGVLCLAVVFALLPRAARPPDPGDLPLATAVPAPWWGHVAYPFLLVAALWTTGSAAALGVAQRLAPGASGRAAALAPLAMLPLALLGLPRLVAAGYPLLGYAGLPVLGGLALLPFRRRPPSARGRVDAVTILSGTEGGRRAGARGRRAP